MRKGTKKWNDIKGYEGLYQITRKGEVYSFKSGKILKPDLTRFGYYRIQLWKNGKQYKHLLHRLIAEHFIDNPNNYSQVNHKKGIKKDNRISQLEWVTASMNMQHAHKTCLKHGMKKEKNPIYKRDISLFPYALKVINTITKEIIYLKTASIESGIPYSYFYKMIVGLKNNKTHYKLIK